MHSSGQCKACLILGREFYWVAISEFTIKNCANCLNSFCDEFAFPNWQIFVY
jgi:hypothetical protein